MIGMGFDWRWCWLEGFKTFGVLVAGCINNILCFGLILAKALGSLYLFGMSSLGVWRVIFGRHWLVFLILDLLDSSRSIPYIQHVQYFHSNSVACGFPLTCPFVSSR